MNRFARQPLFFKPSLSFFFLVVTAFLLSGCGFHKARQPQLSPQQMYELGLSYGRDFEKNVAQRGEQAVYWLERSAKHNYLPAVHALGWLYFEGRGVKKDLSRAEEYFRRAAVQGYADSQYLLGLFYAQGWGVEKNSGMALQWIKKAADQGHVEARQCIEALFNRPSSVGK